MSKAGDFIKLAWDTDKLFPGEPWHSVYRHCASLHLRMITDKDDSAFNGAGHIKDNPEDAQPWDILKISISHQLGSTHFHITEAEALALGGWLVETFGEKEQ